MGRSDQRKRSLETSGHRFNCGQVEGSEPSWRRRTWSCFRILFFQTDPSGRSYRTNLYPAVWTVMRCFGLEGFASIFLRSERT